jgi:DNA mismatch repair protein MutS
VREGPDDIVFLHRLAPGSADKSYGIHVARVAGVPREVLDRAEQMLAELEGGPKAGTEQPVPLDMRRNGQARQVR